MSEFPIEDSIMATVEKPDTSGIPWTERDRRIWAEIDWAEQNARALSAYYGEWVAIHDRNDAAHLNQPPLVR